MKMTNNEIYMHANALMEAFNDGEQRLPIKVNFYLQKNKNRVARYSNSIFNAIYD